MARAEETPRLHQDLFEAAPAARAPGTVSVQRCYLCDSDLSKIPEEFVDRRAYEYSTATRHDPGVVRSYLISVCWRCWPLLQSRSR